MLPVGQTEFDLEVRRAGQVVLTLGLDLVEDIDFIHVVTLGERHQMLDEVARPTAEATVLPNVDQHRDVLAMSGNRLRPFPLDGAQHLAKALLCLLNLPVRVF
nr:hypothetical protein [Alloactinosynnema sp. L-07]